MPAMLFAFIILLVSGEVAQPPLFLLVIVFLAIWPLPLF